MIPIIVRQSNLARVATRLTCISDVLTLSYGWDTKCSLCTPQSFHTHHDMALNWT